MSYRFEASGSANFGLIAESEGVLALWTPENMTQVCGGHKVSVGLAFTQEFIPRMNHE